MKGNTKLTIKQIETMVPELMQEKAINTTCSIPLEKMYLEYAVKLVNIYKELDGRRLFQTVVEKKDCTEKIKLRKLNN